MDLSYEPRVERIRQHTQHDGLSDMRLAREEFHRLTGEFDEGEPWFELRMTMFHDWYLLDRMGSTGRTPAEVFVLERGPTLDPAERLQHLHLTVTLRSTFRLSKIQGDQLSLEDMVLGGHWLVTWTLPTVGLLKDDILDARIVLVNGTPTTGRGAVLHPREAQDSIQRIVDRAVASRMPPRAVVDHLDKMRLKLDRYSNVKIKHVYQYPDDAVL
jgi:hypothetical protein